VVGPQPRSKPTTSVAPNNESFSSLPNRSLKSIGISAVVIADNFVYIIRHQIFGIKPDANTVEIPKLKTAPQPALKHQNLDKTTTLTHNNN
jgi:hypothetical protein